MPLCKPFFAIIWLLSFFAGTSAQRQDGTNVITFPNIVNQSFHYMDTVDVAYTTDYATPWMYLLCNQTGNQLIEIVYYSPSDVVKRTSIAFTLQYDYMPQVQCWFNLRSAQRDPNDINTEQGATSPAFSYNKTEDGPSTFAPATTSASATSTASSSSATSTTNTASTVTATVAAPSSAPSDSSASTASGGLSTGAKAGIGVGVSAAVIAIAVAAVFLWRQRRKRAVPTDPYTMQHSDISGPEPKELASSSNTPKPYELVNSEKTPPQQGPYELEPERRHHELP